MCPRITRKGVFHWLLLTPGLGCYSIRPGSSVTEAPIKLQLVLRACRRSRRVFEMCGIVGLLLAAEDGHANQELFDSLTALQHRGQGQSSVGHFAGLLPPLALSSHRCVGGGVVVLAARWLRTLDS